MDEPNKVDLRRIAHQAMIDRGLEPDFPPAVDEQLKRITGAAHSADHAPRDLRGLLWCSIDNDTSEDLDQLTVAESLPSKAVKVLVAIANVDALVKPGSAHRRARCPQYHVGLHGGRNLSHASRRAYPRT